MSYINTLSAQKKENAATLVKRLRAKGITSAISQGGMLAVVSKESEFVPKNELSYRNTANSRIHIIFGKRVAGITDADLDLLKKDDAAFFDKVYGGTKLGLGNDHPGDGFKYRGRGFNQITGKAAYKMYGNKIGVDLVTNPDLLNDPVNAADAMIEFFKTALTKSNLAKYHATDINSFATEADSVGAFYHANAGFGNSVVSIQADPTGGLKRAKERVHELVAFAQSVPA